MTLIELRYITTLADELHIGRTAARCHVSQPTLSIALRKLEEELGVVLFERTKTSIKLTPEGAPIIAQARVVLASVADIKSLAEAGRDQLAAPLVLGTLTTLGPYLLPQLIAQLQQWAPEMPLYVQEDTAESLRRKLRDGVVDTVLIPLPFAMPEVVTQRLFDEPLVVLVPRAHPLACKQIVDIPDIAQEPLLLMAEGHCLRDQALALCPWAALQPETVSVNSLEMLRNLVAAGMGVSIVPASAAEVSLCRASRVAARPLAIGQRTLGLAWRSSFPRYRAIDVLRRAIQTCSSSWWGFTTEADGDAQSLLQASW
ncbi:hydrogen peroxide-inducible genes activator [Cellvibrio japonicus]|uniref:Transcriptional regulator, LysR family n=1 Tax=Cellvibrio japonicus (strain Ueda107) TaxID=498211 RepID=B3PDU8_CELJU|nr:hydrogen peroxide-inducible genes activator [Cellvibrio japonicus]ACE83721.1 transcriptional regulator, LysR family [Cellvibrio japonicus Ueda107]QEI13435.1 hydrogen peroxide-inducible genes activator [Cellvibrio japonicus]QEI17009.1 hydrogen peroxide-inducible genes activator [Cellvibrio japonicus]QEI20587.1 hydrogen peroxide-inducible genes activator [Cellvibrio japonicus]